MNVCHNHNDFVVVYGESRNTCPVCEIILNNFRMRAQLLTGAKPKDLDLCKLPKAIRKIYLDIIRYQNKRKKERGVDDFNAV